MSDYGADPDPVIDKIREVAHAYRFAPQENLKVDQHSTASDHKVYHLVRKLGSTNMIVLVDPADLPPL